MELEREHPNVKASMLKAIANVMPRHLLDRRLNPVRELEAQAASAIDDLGELTPNAPLIPLLTHRPQ
jgi:tRNA 2-thiocytidine biosynthesis protein TtcA